MVPVHFYPHPRTDLILQAPIGFRLHALSAWVLFAFWPFSRLVHVFSAPLGYLTRPYIVYRSRDAQLGTRPHGGAGNASGKRTAVGSHGSGSKDSMAGPPSPPCGTG